MKTDQRNVRLRNNINHFDAYDFWINYSNQGNYNPPHTHSKDLSFVIYLKLPDWQEELDNHVANSQKQGSILFKNELPMSATNTIAPYVQIIPELKTVKSAKYPAYM